MANETDLVVKIRAETKEGIQELNKLQIKIKELDLEFKKNKGTAEQIAAVNAKVENSYKGVQESLDRMTGGTLKYVNVSTQLFHAQNRASIGFKSMATSVVDLNKASQQSRTALLSVSQAIQDAPYGIRGMSNNIDFLAQQFLVLRANAGSTGAALKLMFTNLGTASGVLIGFSIISAGINYFTNLKKSSDEATVSIENFNNAYIKALTSGLGDVAVMGAATLKAKYERENKDAELRNKQILAGAKVVTGGGMGSYGSGRLITELQEKEIANNNKIINNNTAKLIVVNNILTASLAQLQVERDLLGLGKSDKKLKEEQAKADRDKIAENKKTQDAIGVRIDVAWQEYELGRATLENTIKKVEIEKKLLSAIKEKNQVDIDIQSARKAEADENTKKAEEQLKLNKEQYDDFKEKLDFGNADKVLTDEELIAQYKLLLIEAEKLGLTKEQINLRQGIAKLLLKEEIAVGKVKDMFDTLEAAGKQTFRTLGRDLSESLFSESMRNSKNFFNMLVVSFGDALVQMEAQAIAADIFAFLKGDSGKSGFSWSSLLMSAISLFTGVPTGNASGGYINEPIMGIGASGRRYSFGEKGSELIIPNNRLANNMNSSRGAGGGAMNVIVTGKLKGRDIYLSNKYQSSYETLVRYA